MIYVNENLVNTRNRNKDYEYSYIVDEYHKVIKEVMDYYGDYITVETRIRPYQDKKTGVPRHPGPRGLLLTSTVNRRNEDGSADMEELRYSPTILKKDEHGSLIHESPNMLISRGAMSIDVKRNPDLVYYVMKCGKIGRTTAEGKKFHIYDVKHIKKEGASRRRMEGKVLNLIYSSIPEDKLCTLAKSFGVSEVNRKDIETIREDLFENLQAAEAQLQSRPDSKARGFKAFVESAEVRYQDQVAALCSDAMDKDRLLYLDNERRWVIDYKDGGTPYVLKELAGDEYGDPLGSLVNYLLSEPNQLRKVENVMGIGQIQEPKVETTSSTVKTESVEMSEEMIMTTSNVMVLKSMLKQIDPDHQLPKTAKAEGVKKILLEKVREQSLQGA